MISITSAPEAPPPRISIMNDLGREVETVRIGDKLRFRIEIPPNSESDSNTLTDTQVVNLGGLSRAYR